MDELISVIVPVYKTQMYLEECVDSILANTYRNLEVILIDDGSPDQCGAICDRYASLDARVMVIHQENKGLVGARNAGLAAANGAYVSFVDSDDAISPVFYEVMAGLMKSEQADAVACDCRHQYDKLCFDRAAPGTVRRLKQYEEKLALITLAPAVRKFSWTGVNVWNKLYRRACIRERFVPECLMCEDLRFNYDYIKSCGTVITISAPLYYYRINSGSIMDRYRSSYSNLQHGIAHALQWAEIASDPVQDEKLGLYLKARAVYMAHGCLWRIFAAGQQDHYSDYAAAAKRLIYKDFHSFIHEHDTYNFKVRAVVSVCRWCFPLWQTAARMLK